MTTPKNFRPDIQGLRAIAVMAVVLYHASVPFLPGGYVGVDVFFVISGFLITSHLLSSIETYGKIRLTDFYAKRARRILPASLVVLALSLILAVIIYPPLLMREVWLGAVATAFYVPNILFAAQGTNYLAETTPSLFQHYWSLGIEEQFYLIWPLALIAIFAISRTRRSILLATGALVLASSILCIFLTFREQPLAFFLLPTRAWELGVGGLVAILVSDRARRSAGWVNSAVGWAGIAMIAGAVLFFSASTPFPGYWAAIPVLGTAAVITAGHRPSPASPFTLLSIRPMLFVGGISYSLYLIHWPVLQLAHAGLGFEVSMPLWLTLGLAVVCVPVAWAMYRYVEQPFRSPRRWTRRSRQALGAAAVTSVVIAAGATGAYAYSSNVQLDAGVRAQSAPLAVPPSFSSFVPSNMSPSLRAVSADQPETYGDGCHLDFAAVALADCLYGSAEAPRIVLFGDSHAAQWFPALKRLAEKNGWAVQNRTKSSCPSISTDVLRNEVPYQACSEWRTDVIRSITEDPPQLVVISNFGYATLSSEPLDASSYSDLWAAGLSRTLESIDVPTVVLADTPNLRTTPSVCLSAHLNDTSACGRTPADALASPAREAEKRAAAGLGIPYIDLNDYMCTTERCLPVIGTTLAYRDAHHITATFSAELSPALESALIRADRVPAIEE